MKNKYTDEYIAKMLGFLFTTSLFSLMDGRIQIVTNYATLFADPLLDAKISILNKYGEFRYAI